MYVYSLVMPSIVLLTGEGYLWITSDCVSHGGPSLHPGQHHELPSHEGHLVERTRRHELPGHLVEDTRHIAQHLT